MAFDRSPDIEVARPVPPVPPPTPYDPMTHIATMFVEVLTKGLVIEDESGNKFRVRLATNEEEAATTRRAW